MQCREIAAKIHDTEAESLNWKKSRVSIAGELNKWSTELNSKLKLLFKSKFRAIHATSQIFGAHRVNLSSPEFRTRALPCCRAGIQVRKRVETDEMRTRVIQNQTCAFTSKDSDNLRSALQKCSAWHIKSWQRIAWQQPAAGAEMSLQGEASQSLHEI